MKVYGELSMFNADTNTFNRTQKMRLGLLPDFPDSPNIGNLVFKDKKLYIYAEINTVNVWIPLTSEIVYYTALFTNINPWITEHGLDTDQTILQLYDENNNMIFADEIDNSVPGVTRATFSSNQSGRMFLVQRLANVDRISVFAVDEGGNYITDQSGNYIVTN